MEETATATVTVPDEEVLLLMRRNPLLCEPEAQRIVQRRRDEAEARRRIEEDRQRRREEEHRAAVAERVAAAREEAAARQAFIDQPFSWSEQRPPAGDSRPVFVLTAWGAGLADAYQDRLRRERDEEQQAAAAAAEASRAGEAHQHLAKLEALDAGTRQQLADARAERSRQEAAAAARLAAGEDPVRAERAARDAAAVVEQLEARLPVLAESLRRAREKARRVEDDASARARSEIRQRRQAEQEARDEAAETSLMALWRALLGLDAAPAEATPDADVPRSDGELPQAECLVLTGSEPTEQGELPPADEGDLTAFISERCVVGEGHEVRSSDLFAAWIRFAAERGRWGWLHSTYMMRLRSRLPQLGKRQPQEGDDRPRYVTGLGLVAQG